MRLWLIFQAMAVEPVSKLHAQTQCVHACFSSRGSMSLQAHDAAAGQRLPKSVVSSICFSQCPVPNDCRASSPAFGIVQSTCRAGNSPTVLIVDSCPECSLTIPAAIFADVQDPSVGHADVTVKQASALKQAPWTLS